MRLRDPLPLGYDSYYGYLACVNQDKYLIEGAIVIAFGPEANPTILDVTYGKGIMWKNCCYHPDIKLDKRSRGSGVISGDFLDMRDVVEDESVDVIVFDPPHLPDRHDSKFRKSSSSYMTDTYGLGKGVTTGGNNISAFYAFYLEAYRVLRLNGIVLTKVADLVMESFTEWQQVTALARIIEAGLWPVDLGIKYRNNATISSTWINQNHFRKNMSYWIVAAKREGPFPKEIWPYNEQKAIEFLKGLGYEVTKKGTDEEG